MNTGYVPTFPLLSTVAGGLRMRVSASTHKKPSGSRGPVATDVEIRAPVVHNPHQAKPHLTPGEWQEIAEKVSWVAGGESPRWRCRVVCRVASGAEDAFGLHSRPFSRQWPRAGSPWIIFQRRLPEPGGCPALVGVHSAGSGGWTARAGKDSPLLCRPCHSADNRAKILQHGRGQVPG